VKTNVNTKREKKKVSPLKMTIRYAKELNQKLILLSGDIGCLDRSMNTLNEDLLLEL
jgi:hypothetical protein